MIFRSGEYDDQGYSAPLLTLRAVAERRNAVETRKQAPRQYSNPKRSGETQRTRRLLLGGGVAHRRLGAVAEDVHGHANCSGGTYADAGGAAISRAGGLALVWDGGGPAALLRQQCVQLDHGPSPPLWTAGLIARELPRHTYRLAPAYTFRCE